MSSTRAEQCEADASKAWVMIALERVKENWKGCNRPMKSKQPKDAMKGGPESKTKYQTVLFGPTLPGPLALSWTTTSQPRLGIRGGCRDIPASTSSFANIDSECTSRIHEMRHARCLGTDLKGLRD